MGHRLSKIYTRTGDAGTTGLGDGSRVAKDDPRVEAMGAVDELNSFIGLLLVQELPAALREILTKVQHDLFDLGGELARPGVETITAEYVTRLERTLDSLNADLPPLKEFILPGGGQRATLCHVARSVCRRAERRVIALFRTKPLNPETLRYLNRLSDLLFVIARVLARQAGEGEVYWDPGHRQA